ncbi:MAG: acetylxylan esterase [Bryobacteraceae bacterium]
MADRSISRRLALPLLAAPVLAQQQILYRDYSLCLPKFLQHLAGEAVRRRNEAIGKLTSAAAVEERKRWARQTFWDLTGGPLERTPLRIRTTGSFDRPGYKVEKLVYETQPELFVTANLYIPKTGKPPYPGVLFQLGHSVNGKAAAPYQKCCQGLAQLGFLVLAFDTMGQGERAYYPGATSPLTRLRSADDEHTLPGQQMLLVGKTSTQLQVWDSIRSLDVLASHPLCDARHLASTGNSGGGTTTMFLAAVDDRLTCAAPSCPNSENFACEEFNPPGSTDDAEQNFVYGGTHGFDRWDMLYPLAPKPLLILVSGKDFFGTYSPSYIKNGRQEYARLASVYRTLGKADHLGWWESPLPHGLNYSARMEIYRWFRRWMQNDPSPLAAEPPVKAETEEALWVTEKGSVVRSLASTRPAELARKMPRTQKPADLKQILSIEEIYERPRRIKLGTVASEGCSIDAFEVSTATHVWVPCWQYNPAKPRRSDEVLIMLDSGGRNIRWTEGGLYHELADAGITVVAPDLRGIGDLSPEAGRGATRYTISHATEHNYAWASLMLGQSLLGQRVVDLISVVKALAPAKVRVAAQGRMTVPALFAAALEPRIEHVYLAGGLASYQHLLDAEEYPHPFANFLPRVLLHTDLPQVAASLKLSIGGAVDGAGKALVSGEVSKLYPKATVHADAAWSVARLSAL